MMAVQRWRRRAAAAAIAAFLAVAAAVQTAPGKPTSPPTGPPPVPTTQPASGTTRPAADTQTNPAAPGFDEAGSDLQAIRVADMVMEKLGGRAAWDATRHLSWNFFGQRRHFWDKRSGRIRIEGTQRGSDKPYVVLMNVNTREGRVWVGGEEVAAAALKEELERGYRWWVNDSYWLVMPYKLKESGVTLLFLGDQPMEDGRDAYVLRLRFKDVGVTPDNQYDVYVGRASGLVEQWDFYLKAGDAKPVFSTPWRGWKQYGRIMLSHDRGTLRGEPAELSSIAVFDDVPESVYESPDPVDLQALQAPAAPRPPAGG
jgi:hypothetical protein